MSDNSEGILKLYSYYRSSCSYRVRLSLNYKKIPHEIIPVNLIKELSPSLSEKGEQNTAPYRQKNPKGEVPTLEIGKDAFALTQSMAILLYLEEALEYQEYKKLLPTHPKAPTLFRSCCLELCEMINSGIQPLQNLRVLNYLPHSTREEKDNWAHHWIKLGMDSLYARYQLIKKHFSWEGPFSLGEDFSLFDVFLIPQIYNAYRFQVPMAPYKDFERIYEYCLSMPYVIESMPESQRDFPR